MGVNEPSPELPIWPCDVAGFSDGIVEMMTGDGIAVAATIGLLWPFGRGKPVEPSVVEPGEHRSGRRWPPPSLRAGLERERLARRGGSGGGRAAAGQAVFAVRDWSPGVAPFDWLRARRAKTLTRQFVLAVPAGRVIAFASAPWAGGVGSVDAGWIKRGGRGSWPRHLVWVREHTNGSWSKGATLELGGLPQRVPVAWDRSDGTDELIELLDR